MDYQETSELVDIFSYNLPYVKGDETYFAIIIKKLKMLVITCLCLMLTLLLRNPL